MKLEYKAAIHFSFYLIYFYDIKKLLESFGNPFIISIISLPDREMVFV